ncbi:unnamed protein product, partial [Amoebophrya sp. A25]
PLGVRVLIVRVFVRTTKTVREGIDRMSGEKKAANGGKESGARHGAEQMMEEMRQGLRNGNPDAGMRFDFAGGKTLTGGDGWRTNGPACFARNAPGASSSSSKSSGSADAGDAKPTSIRYWSYYIIRRGESKSKEDANQASKTPFGSSKKTTSKASGARDRALKKLNKAQKEGNKSTSALSASRGDNHLEVDQAESSEKFALMDELAEWLVSCYRMRVHDDLQWCGGYMRGPYAPWRTAATVCADFLLFVKLVVKREALPRSFDFDFDRFLDRAADLLPLRFQKEHAKVRYGD